MSLRLLLLCTTLGALVARPARAQEPTQDSGPPRKQHLLQATVRGGAAWLGGDIDEHYSDSGLYGGFGLGYSLATRGVDLGAGFDFLTIRDPDHPRRAYVPTLSLRFHVPIGQRVEFGLGLRAGWSWVTMESVRDDDGKLRDHTFSGLHLGLLPHVRWWLAPRFSLDLGVELLLAGGGDSLGQDVRNTYLQRTAHIGVFGGFLRANFGF